MKIVFPQRNLNRIRTTVAKHRAKDVDLVVSIIGLHPNLAAIKPHLDENPVEIAKACQKALSLSLLEDGEAKMPPSQNALEWRCDTTSLPQYKNAKFEASFEIHYDKSFPGSYITVMHGTHEEAQRLEPYYKKLGSKYLDIDSLKYLRISDYGNILGFATLYAESSPPATAPNTVIVKNLQTELFQRSVGIPNALRNRYKYWDRVLLLAIENFARFIKSPLVWITTANYQLRKWNLDKLLTIHPTTAFNVYSQSPFKMGYSLREIQPRVIESTKCDLVWEKDFTAD